MSAAPSPALTRAQDAAIRGAERTQNALLVAQEHLYTALRRPQPRRERSWAAKVGEALVAALAALRSHCEEVDSPEGLYVELLRDAPWTSARLRQVRAQLARLESEAVDLQIEVARVEAGDLGPLAAIRADAERMLFALRDLLNKEADLIYERFNEPGALD